MDEFKGTYNPKIASFYKGIQEAVRDFSGDREVGLFSKRNKPRNTEPIPVENLYMIEALSAKIMNQTGNFVYSIDLVFLLIMRDYEYISRAHLLYNFRFLSKVAQYQFFDRQKKNKFVRSVVSRLRFGHSKTAFLLTDFGNKVADDVYNLLLSGDQRGLRL